MTKEECEKLLNNEEELDKETYFNGPFGAFKSTRREMLKWQEEGWFRIGNDHTLDLPAIECKDQYENKSK